MNQRAWNIINACLLLIIGTVASFALYTVNNKEDETTELRIALQEATAKAGTLQTELSHAKEKQDFYQQINGLEKRLSEEMKKSTDSLVSLEQTRIARISDQNQIEDLRRERDEARDQMQKMMETSVDDVLKQSTEPQIEIFKIEPDAEEESPEEVSPSTEVYTEKPTHEAVPSLRFKTAPSFHFHFYGFPFHELLPTPESKIPKKEFDDNLTQA